MTTYQQAGWTYDQVATYGGVTLTPGVTTLILNDVDVTAYLADRSLGVHVGTHGNSLGTLDAKLNDPPANPATEQMAACYAGTLQLFDGTVRSVELDEHKPGSHHFASFSAQDEGPDGGLPTAAPFGLSDAPGTGYVNAVLATVPVAYWRLGEATPGTGTAVDVMAANNGTYVASPTSVAGLLTGDLDTAVTLNGSTQLVSVARGSIPQLSSGSLAVVFRLAALGATQALWDDDFAHGPLFYCTSANKLRLRLGDVAGVGAIADLSGATTLSAGVIYHAVAVWDPANCSIYLNGVQDGTGAVTGAIGTQVGALGIGSRNSFGDLYFNGTLDEPAIWNRALSAAEVAALYAAAPIAPGITYGYGRLRKLTRTTEGGSPVTTYTATYRADGLWANMNVELTSSILGLSALELTIKDATVKWPTRNAPEYTFEIGEPLVHLAQLVTDAVVPPAGSITETQISDGAISTPKLAANAVIANLVNVAGHVVISDTGVAIGNGALSVTNPGGTVIIDGEHDMFRILATGTLSSVLFAAPGNPGSQVSATVTTGLSYKPIVLVYMESNAGAEAHLLPRITVNNAGVLLDWFTCWAEQSGGDTKVQVTVSSTRVGGLPAYTFRYYILEQAAI